MEDLRSFQNSLLNSITLLYVSSEDKYDKELAEKISDYVKNIIVVQSFKEAADISVKKDIDIVIMDFYENDVESISLPAIVRSRNPLCNVFIYTNNEHAEHMLEAIELHIDKYLIKPTDFAKVMHYIISITERLFALHSLDSYVDTTKPCLDIESYDTIVSSIDKLKDLSTKLTVHECDDSMFLMHEINEIRNNLKVLLKRGL